MIAARDIMCQKWKQKRQASGDVVANGSKALGE
jgi:hypothetical protein